MGFAFITLVLVFYLYFKYLKCKSSAFAIILIIMGCLIVFFHPVTAFMLIIALLIMEFGRLLFDRIYVRRCGEISQANKISLILPLLFFVTLMLWIWEKASVWDNSIVSVAGWFHAELLKAPMTEKAAEAFDKIGLSTSGQLELFVRMFGHYFFYLGLSLIAIGAISRKCFISLNDDDRGIFQYSVFFFPATTIWLTDYVMPLTTLSSGRMIWLMTALFPTLVGLALYNIWGIERNEIEKETRGDVSLNNGKIVRELGVILIIIICSVIGIFAIHPSPLTLQANWATSYAMVDGQRWLLERGDPNINVLNSGTTSPGRYADALFGIGTTERNYPSAIRNEQNYDHFNYNLGYATFGESFEGNRYMILRDNFIKLLYTELYPKMEDLIQMIYTD